MPGLATDAQAHSTAAAEQGVVDGEATLLLLLADLADVDRDFVICIDNLHELTDPEAWQVMAHLLAQRPKNMRLRLASRFLPMPLGRLRLIPGLSFIHQDVLAFTQTDVMAWLEQTQIGHVQQLSLTLMARLRGWPGRAGLVVGRRAAA